MTSRSSLLAGTAVCALVFAGAASPALAKPVKHRHHAAAASSNAGEIEALKSQVQALTDRLNAQDAAQQQTQAQAQAAQSQAIAAQQQAEAAQAAADNQIRTIPTEVQSAVAAATPKPKPSWADNTQISGRYYFDLSNITQKTNGTKVAPSGTGFDIKRFYVGVDHKFNDTYSANLTMDMQYSSAISSTEFFVKKAYLQAKYSNAFIIRLGSADLPWIPFAEDAYGYRFVENTVSDRDKFGTSADWGVHALGSFGDKGMFSYAVSVVDGAGYKAPLRSKGMDVEGRFSAKFDGVTLGIGGYTGKLGKDTEGAVTYHTAQRFNALASYSNKAFRVGVEYFNTTDWTSVATVAKDSSNGYSFFGNYNFTPEISVFGRYDYVKPNKDTASAKRDNYFNVGLNYEPVKILDLALVYKRDKIDNGTLSTSNGTIGGSNEGTYDEFGLFGQVRW